METKNSKLVIVGARDLAELAYHYFDQDSPYAVCAFAVDGAYLKEPSLCGLPIVPLEQLDSEFPAVEHDVFVAIGIGAVNHLRAEKLAAIESRGYRAASFVSSRAIVGRNVQIRPNTMVMDGAILMPSVEIGRDCIVFPQSGVGYGSKIGDHCWIATATVAGHSSLGAYTFVGVRATVGPGVTLGESCVVGSGAVVLSDAPGQSVFRAPKARRSKASTRFLKSFGLR